MSAADNSPEERRKRIQRIIWAVKGNRLKEEFPNFAVADVALLVERLEALDLDDRADADPLMRWVLERLKEDRAQKSEWLEDALEQVRIAELCLNEAVEAEAAVSALIGGALFRNGDRINAHWDGVISGYYAAGLLPQRAVQPEPDPEPEPPPLGERIMAELDFMVKAHGQDLDANKLAARLSEKPDHVRAALVDLAKAKRLQYVRRQDRNQIVVLPLGASLATPTLTANQGAVFNALISVADADWRCVISQGRLRDMTGIVPGSINQILSSLDLKDHVRIIERGNAKTPATYLICEGVRPVREAIPKTDAELIADALAAGRVTRVPAPGSTEVH